jgi:hypothetical protein
MDKVTFSMYMLCYIQTMFYVSKLFLLQFRNNFLCAIKFAHPGYATVSYTSESHIIGTDMWD